MGNPGACLINQGRPAQSGSKIMRLKVKKEVLEKRSEKKTGNAEGGIISELVGRSLLPHHCHTATCTVTAI